ncbi:unnamed protein product [Polarella glacialis]|uniref:Ribosomal RNA methyltransferase FtsJ domain-containing protein n=1 Tax=Polarella glacialis TaxID=89957 RepID=A0A813E3D7_POLGL|nr:unnamed protein product [Polarella glacialis]
MWRDRRRGEESERELMDVIRECLSLPCTVLSSRTASQSCELVCWESRSQGCVVFPPTFHAMRRASGCYQGVREAEALQILSRFDFAKLLSPGGCPTFEFYILHEALLEPLGSVDAKQLAHQLRSFHELLVKHFGVSCLVPCVQVPLQELPPSDLEEHMECGTSEVRRQLTAEDVVACRTEDVKSSMLDALLEHCISSGLDPTPLPFLLLGLSAACALDMRDELVGRVTPVGAGGVKRTPVIVPSSVGVLLRSKPWIMSSRHGPCCAPDLLFPDQSSHSCLKEDARHVQLPESPATAELVSHLLDNLGVQRFSVAHVLKQLRLYSAADKQLLTEAQLTSMYLFLHHHMGQDGEIGQAMASGERLIFVPFERRLTKMNNTEANLRKGYWVSIADCCIMEVRFGQRIGCGMLLSLSGSPIRELELHYNKSLRDPFLHFGCRLEVSIHQLFVSIAYAAGNCKGPQHDPERALMWILRVLKWWQDGHLAQEDFDDVRRHFAEHAVLLSQDDAWRLWAETADDSGLFLPSDVPCPPNRLVSTKMKSIWPLLRDIGMKRAPSNLFSCEETQGCSGNEASTASQSAGAVQAGAAAQPQGSAQDNFKASEPTTAGVKPTEASSVELSLRRCLAYFQVWFYRLYPTEYQLVDSKVRDGLAESGALLSPTSSAGLQVCDDPGLQGLLKVLETFVFPAAHAAGLESKELSRLGVGLARDVWDRLQQAQDPARAAEKVLRLRGAPGRDPATEQLAWWLEEAPIPLGPPPARRGRSQHRDRAGPATSLAFRGKVAARRSLSQVVGPQSETATHLGQRQNRRPPQRLRAEAPAFDGSKILVADSRITGDVRRNAFAPMASHWSLPQVLPWLGRSMHRAGIDRASDDYSSSQAHWQPAGFAGTADSSGSGAALGHAGAVHMGTASFQNDTRAVSRVVSGGLFRGPWTEYRESGLPSRELGATGQIRLGSPDRRPNYAGETSQPEVALAAGSQSAGSHPWNGERRHNSDTDGRSKQHVRVTHQAGFGSKAPAHRRRKLLRRSSSAPPSMGPCLSDMGTARRSSGKQRPPSDSEEVAASLLRDWLSLAQMLEVDSAADGVVMMPVDKLGWSHDRIYDHFGDGKSVYETVVELLMEKIRPVDLPALEIVCLGSRIYSISNRRLLAFKTFQLVLRRLKSEDSEVLVPVRLKRPTGDFFRRVGIALSTDTLGRSVGVSGPSGMSQAPEAQESLVAAVPRAVVRSARHIDHYEDQPWTVCQPAHPGRARQLGYKHQPEAWPDGATWNIHHCQIDEEVRRPRKEQEQENIATYEETMVHYHKSFGVMQELFDHRDFSTLAEEIHCCAALGGMHGAPRFLDLGCAPGGFSGCLLQDHILGPHSSGYGVSLPPQLGGFEMVISPDRTCVQFHDLMTIQACELLCLDNTIDLCVADAQYLSNMFKPQHQVSKYRGTQVRSRTLGIWCLTVKECQLAFAKLRQGGGFVFRFGWRGVGNADVHPSGEKVHPSLLAKYLEEEEWYKSLTHWLFSVLKSLFKTLRPFKSEYVHQADVSFYMVCRQFDRQKYEQNQWEARLQRTYAELHDCDDVANLVDGIKNSINDEAKAEIDELLDYVGRMRALGIASRKVTNPKAFARKFEPFQPSEPKAEETSELSQPETLKTAAVAPEVANAASSEASTSLAEEGGEKSSSTPVTSSSSSTNGITELKQVGSKALPSSPDPKPVQPRGWLGDKVEGGSKGSKGGGSKGSKAPRRMADRMPPPQFDAATVGFGGSSCAIQSSMQWESSSSQMMYHYGDQAFAQNQMDMFPSHYAAQVTMDSHGPASHPGDWQHVDSTWQRHMLQTDDGHMLQVCPMSGCK